MTTKAELIKENKLLKERLDKERSKEKCFYCNGSGKIWRYGMDGDQSCPRCGGSGRA